MFQDLRYGMRALIKNPGFALTVILLLALGIGANTAIFSVTDAILLKMLPVREPEQLILLSHTERFRDRHNFTYENYERFRDNNQALSGVLAYYPLRLTVRVDAQPEPAINGQLVTGNYYAVLGVNAAVGRTIMPDDDRVPGAHPICVISDGYWGRRFGRDPNVIGKVIHISGFPFTVIGVTPPEFFGLEVGISMDISVPVTMREQAMPGVTFYNRDNNRFRVLGRLRPGATIEQAQASLELLYQQDTAAQKMNQPTFSRLEQQPVVTSGSRGLSALRRQFTQPLFILMGVVALVLLIACANVAGLMLVRAVARRKEMTVRLALGAGRPRLIRQMLTESFLLAGLSGLLGLLFAWWGTKLFLPMMSKTDIPLHLRFNPNLRMLGFTMLVAVFTVVLFGLAPAFLATRVDLQSALKQDSREGSGRAARLGLNRGFVIAQVALSLLLLVGAGLFVRSLQQCQHVDPGFVRENLLVLKLEPVGSDRKSRALPRLTTLYDEIVRRVEALPGVRQASLVGYSPISRSEWLEMGQTPETSSPMNVEGYAPRTNEEMRINNMQVYPNSFAVLGIPFVAGRDFGPGDSGEGKYVAVINESMASRFFGGGNPIGRSISYQSDTYKMEIVGVVKDVKYKSLREPGRPMFYLPFAQAQTGRGQMTLIVRTAGDPAPVAVAVQREVRTLDPTLPMFEAETLVSHMDASLVQERLVATLLSVFGFLALLMACIGLYGVMAYEVARRTHEIGIRMALGTSTQGVLWLVLGETLRLAGVGILIGLGAALAATWWMESLFFGIQSYDPQAIGLAVFVLLAVAAAAGYLPARRASLINPMTALRHE